MAIEYQRLLFGTKELEDVCNGEEMTFERYGVTPEASIVLVTRLPGGCVSYS